MKLLIIASEDHSRAIETKKKQIVGLSPAFDALHVEIVYNHVGKLTGDAEVLFANEADARKDVTKHKQKLQQSYRELIDVDPVGSPSRSMPEFFNIYPKANREQKQRSSCERDFQLENKLQ